MNKNIFNYKLLIKLVLLALGASLAYYLTGKIYIKLRIIITILFIIIYLYFLGFNKVNILKIGTKLLYINKFQLLLIIMGISLVLLVITIGINFY